MKLHKVFQMLSVVFLISTCYLSYLLYNLTWNKTSVQHTYKTEVNVVPAPGGKSTSNQKISEEEIQRLLDVENEQKELILLFERV